MANEGPALHLDHAYVCVCTVCIRISMQSADVLYIRGMLRIITHVIITCDESYHMMDHFSHAV